MVDLKLEDKLQPSLLDRLTDQNRQMHTESKNSRVLSQEAFRQAVLRDLIWLLNTTNFEAVKSLDGFEQVKSSVINYGMPDYSGLTRSTVDPHELEKDIRTAIVNFEPRILSNTLSVKILTEKLAFANNTIMIEISGSLWGQPIPLELFLRTELDLELGDVNVVSE